METGVVLVQLPFPSTKDPTPLIVDYYRSYSDHFKELMPEYFIPENALWELPLWVAHLAGMLEPYGQHAAFLDLSEIDATKEDCVYAILSQSQPNDHVLLSPLAQNMDLAVAVSKQLQQAGRSTILGGNMAPLAVPGDASHVYHGQITPDTLASLLAGNGPPSTIGSTPRGDPITWAPNYDLLSQYHGRVPLLRLNASHGCLFACEFCGDAWSRQLIPVALDAMRSEVDQFEQYFPSTRLIYIGDKTFGQSKTAVTNLLEIFRDRPNYKFIVQTHVLGVNEKLIEQMQQLGVIAVEMGFESADSEMLRALHKASPGEDQYHQRIQQLSTAGMKVILNVLGGLPYETEKAHLKTVDFIRTVADDVWLYNLYNFVPYPLTPYFPKLRDRIFDWTFAHWREDGPSVYYPYHLSVEESWNLFLNKVGCAHQEITKPQMNTSQVLGGAL